jgi:DNA topoisomerase-1
MSILVVVESPAKTKKLASFLGDEYTVTSSKGHIRGLDPKDLGVDIEHNYEPQFIDSTDKLDIISTLKRLAKKSSKVILATDGDVEGHAISWHIAEVCKLKPNERHRAVFTEITKKAILAAVDKLTLLDMNQVHAQFARMVLDKLIGYKVSPLLWKEFKNYHLSAGRVQSPVVRIIAEREDEINKFASHSFFKLGANFVLDKKDQSSKTPKYIETDCEDEIKEQTDIEQVLNLCAESKAIFTIASIKKNTTKRNPQPPFTTSTLQQDASSKLGMSPDVCMKNAQKLYESGLITYMRTDAVFIADDAIKGMEKFVVSKWGDNYFEKRVFKNKSSSAQEAHECCRPTDITKLSVMGAEGMTSGHNRLYQMIWRRTIASQMASAEVEIRTVKIKMEDKDGVLKSEKKKYTFVGKHEKIIFEGFLAAFNMAPKKSAKKDKNKGKNKDDADNTENPENPENPEDDENNIDNDLDNDLDNESDDNESDDNNNDADGENSKGKHSEYLEKIFDKLKEKDQVYCINMDSMQKNTKPPHGRYTEASLIKKLDELGIGRPATYASMVKKVQEEQRQYVERKNLPAKKIKIATLKYNYPSSVDIQTIDAKQEGDKNKLFPTSLGIMINNYLVKNFSDIMNYEFTSKVESLLDEIATGGKVWYKVVDSVYIKLTPIIDQLSKAIKSAGNDSADTTGKSSGKRLLGNNPTNDLPIYVMNTRWGYAVCESHEDKKKSRFANFSSDIDSMTLEDALALLIYPIKLGKYNGHDVLVKRAKNIFINYNEKNYSIDIYNKNNQDDQIDPSHITLNQAISVIESYNKIKESIGKKAENDIKITDDIVITVGRFGPYIKYKNTTNIPIPYKFKPEWEKLTLVQCNFIVDKFRSKKGIKGEKAPVTADTIVDQDFPEAQIVEDLHNDNDDDVKPKGKSRAKSAVPKAKTTDSKEKPTVKSTEKSKAKGKKGEIKEITLDAVLDGDDNVKDEEIKKKVVRKPRAKTAKD